MSERATTWRLCDADRLRRAGARPPPRDLCSQLWCNVTLRYVTLRTSTLVLFLLFIQPDNLDCHDSAEGSI